MEKNDNFWPYSFDISKINVEIESPKEGDVLAYSNQKWINQGISGNSGSSGNNGLTGKSGNSGYGITGFGGTSVPSFVTLSEQINILNKNAKELLVEINKYNPGPSC